MITAIVAAAGLSTRMGQSKPLLPFGARTVIEHIVTILQKCPVDETLVITGHEREAVEQCLAKWPVRAVFNPHYTSGEMLPSIQIGLAAAATAAQAALIILGDQPGLEQSVVEEVIDAYYNGQGAVIVPSYQMRRGHPLLIDRKHWAEIQALKESQTLRDFFKGVSVIVHHVEVTTPTVLRDMDTPADYRRELADYLSRRQL